MAHFKKQNILILCGGPSEERGISLNSARSLFDNLDSAYYKKTVLYVNKKLSFYIIDEKQLYSNTPLDFDYILHHTKSPLSPKQLTKILQNTTVAFPAIHGAFGEDGELQQLLETHKVPYIGSGAIACKQTNDKHLCQEILRKNGFYTVKNWKIGRHTPLPQLPKGTYVVKPLNGGSSLGVHIVHSQKELSKKLPAVLKIDTHALIEPFCTGKEFTIIVLENKNGTPVSLLPTEIEFFHDTLFDYRRKYLSTDEIRYHTPARFSDATIQKIRTQAARVFHIFGMRDMARLDGWLLKDGTIWFSDLNAISGMEQNSFLFQQPALLGFSHRQVLEYILNKKITHKKSAKKRIDVPVLFGGDTAERQVSLMSGTNVWVKLKKSEKYNPIPCILLPEKKSHQPLFYKVPHFFCLHHTVEEIREKIALFQHKNTLKKMQKWQKIILAELGVSVKDLEETLFVPEKKTLAQLTNRTKFVFIGLHGSFGEDGSLQAELDRLGVRYNGPGAAASRLCMDKFATAQTIAKAKIPGVKVANSILLNLQKLPAENWKLLAAKGLHSFIVKPRDDGCSAGIVHIHNQKEFFRYCRFVQSGYDSIPARAIHPHHGTIALPKTPLKEILVEEFIETDRVTLRHLSIEWHRKTDWIEVTIGVLGTKNALHVLYPSQTIATQSVLSLEEKFMGGTGINLTPPPSRFVPPQIIKKVQKKIHVVATLLGLEGYARIDAFINRKTGDVHIIEVNTLPALTPSTVLFHQGLAEKKPLSPRALLEKIIHFGMDRSLS